MISMSLYNIIQNILDVSKNHNLVREVGEGDIYKYLNSSEHQYPCVFLTVSSINDDLNLRNVNCTLFYVDRLTSDESNKILVQSLGLSVLSDIVERIAGDVDTVEYTTFTEKFTDLCGGVYASLSIGYPLDGACSNDFEVRRLEITENGIYDTIGYDEFVIEVVNEELVERVEELTANIEQKEVEISQLEDEVSIKEKQINSVTSLSITENGNYTPEEGVLGWNNINVNVTSATEVWKVPDGTKFYNSSWSSVPALDFSNVTNFGSMFYGCTNLTSIPQMDTSKGTNFNYMFYGCSELINISQIDTSNGTNFGSMFYGCTNLTSVPELNTSKGTKFDSMYRNCINLTSVPELDTSKGTTFNSMFNGCTNLTSVPELNTSKGTDLNYLFNKCTNLITVSTPLDFSEISQLHYLFGECTNLITVSTPLDFSELTYINGAFYKCDNLTNITFVGSINCSIDFSYCKLLSYESVKSILTACSNTNRPTTSKTVTFKRTLTDQNSELVNLIATCNSKRWTVSGLTLQ